MRLLLTIARLLRQAWRLVFDLLATSMSERRCVGCNAALPAEAVFCGPCAGALVLAQDDFLALAAAIRVSGLTPGNSGRLEARVPETGEIEMVSVQVFADAKRQTIVKLPDGKATLDGRGYIKRY